MDLGDGSQFDREDLERTNTNKELDTLRTRVQELEKELDLSKSNESALRVETITHRNYWKDLREVVEKARVFLDKVNAMAPEINSRIAHCEAVRNFEPLSQNWAKEHEELTEALAKVKGGEDE